MQNKKEYLHMKSYEIPIYRGSLVVILTNSKARLQKHLPAFDRDVIYAHSWFDNFKGRQGFFVIFNFDSEYRKITHGAVTHESLHITHFIASRRGLMADFDNDESLAYLSEWISDKMYEFFKTHCFKPI